MLDKYGLDFTASCDFCDETFDTEEDEFRSAIEAIKRAGWKVFKRGQEWFHKCTDCQSEQGADDYEDVT